MKLLFPMSSPLLYRESVLESHVSFDSLVNTSGLFRKAVEKRVDRGDFVAHFGDESVSGTTRVAYSFAGLGTKESPVGVIVPPAETFDDVDIFGHSWSTPYVNASNSDRVSTIVIPTGSREVSRMVYIKHLVESGVFCHDKPHWLYGMTNPAELAVFRRLFTAFTLSKFEYAVCSVCFIYSLFGVSLSEDAGIHLSIPNVNVDRKFDLGMLRWVGSDMGRAQYRIFQRNMDTVSAFCRGELGTEYAEMVCDILGGEVVV